MKFICMQCETLMRFEQVEQPREGSLGVMFHCDKCDARFSMVTNPGETQLVTSLGVELGGRTAPPPAFAMTQGGLQKDDDDGVQMGSYLSGAAASASEGGGCPFSSMLAGMGMGSQGKKAEATAPITWSAEAHDRLVNIPEFIRPMARLEIERLARAEGMTTITGELLDRVRDKFAPAG